MNVPNKEISQRLVALRNELLVRKVGGILVTQPEDVHYLSGYLGDAALLLITKTKQWIFTDGRFFEEAAKSAPAFELLPWKKTAAAKSLLAYVGVTIRKTRARRFLLNENHITVSQYRALSTAAQGVTLESEKGLLAGLRAQKSKWEVRQIKKALQCAEGAFLDLRAMLKPGMTEADIRMELEWRMRKRVASDVSFETIVAADARASLCHAHAGSQKVRAGGLLLIDWGALLNRYHSDSTRMLFFGEPKPFWQVRYEAVREAMEAGFEMIRPGAPIAEAHTRACAVFEKYGWNEYFVHSLGHGVGVQIHEAPTVSRKTEGVFKPGMVVTVEPGLYFPRRGGIRIEDMVLVTETGARRLTTLSPDLQDAIL